MIVGYARVSTQEQSLAAQIEELKAAGAERIFAEKASGAWRERPELARLKAQVTHGDVVLVTRLDRLARSTRDLLNVVGGFSERGVGFRSLKDATIDTTSAQGQLVLQVLAAIGEFERKLIRSRVEDGTKRARERGVRFGRKPKLNPFQRWEAKQRLAAGETQAEVARTFGVDRSTRLRVEGTSSYSSSGDWQSPAPRRGFASHLG
jgi:DNA invertase Pin-like site-specific DNA recombinase